MTSAIASFNCKTFTTYKITELQKIFFFIMLLINCFVLFLRSGLRPQECQFTSDFKAMNLHMATPEDAVNVIVHYYFTF